MMLLLNILEDDKKRYKKHNYIISKYKQELLISRNIANNICMGITSGLLFYIFFRLL